MPYIYNEIEKNGNPTHNNTAIEMIIIEDKQKIQAAPCAATIGCFDGVHCGHKYLVSQVKEYASQAGLKAALITFTVHPRQIMQTDYRPRLLSCPQQKAELISSLDADYCFMLPFTVELSRLSARQFMKYLKDTYNVHALVIGYDHRFGHNRTEDFNDYCRYGKELGIAVIKARALEKDDKSISSSLIRYMLNEGRIEKANEYLGYNYYIDGTIVNGFKIGRTLGFPTANLSPSCPDKLIPSEGVYAVYAYVNGQKYKGMLNIGHRPTVENGNNISIEVHILNFSGDIYNEKLRIEFMHKLRNEEKFDSIELLRQQLQKDKETVNNLLK